MAYSTEFEIVGALFGLGAGNSGSSLAPAVLRQNGLVTRLQRINPSLIDGGDVLSSVYPDERLENVGNGKLKNFKEVYDFSHKLSERLRAVYRARRRPILIGGDHSISIASVSMAAEYAGVDRGSQLGLVWVDAHGDINTPETSPSGNIHGMSVAALLGIGDSRLSNIFHFTPKIRPENLIYIGLRDLDPGERVIIRNLEIEPYTMKEIDLMGIGEVCKEIKKKLSKLDGFVLSFDLDVCDPRFAPGVGTPVRGGLTFREAHLIMETVATMDNLLSVELVEFNPALDKEGLSGEMAIGLLESAIGKTIL